MNRDMRTVVGVCPGRDRPAVFLSPAMFVIHTSCKHFHSLSGPYINCWRRGRLVPAVHTSLLRFTPLCLPVSTRSKPVS